MGLISNDLKNIASKLGDAKNSINAKYSLMRINEMVAPKDIERLHINDLPASIDQIAIGTKPVEPSYSRDVVYVANLAGQPAIVQTVDNGDVFDVIGDEPTRDDGAPFLGWSDVASALTAQYVAGQHVDMSLISQDGTYVLYAVWGESTPPSPPRENTAPSVPVIIMIPAVESNTVKEGRNVSFEAQSYDAEDDAITYEWMIDGVVTALTAKPYSIGEHTVKCRAKDSEGLYSDWSDELVFTVKSAPAVLLRLLDPIAKDDGTVLHPGAFNVYGDVVTTGETLQTTWNGTGYITKYQVNLSSGLAGETFKMEASEVCHSYVTIRRDSSYSEDTNYVTTVYTIRNDAEIDKYVSLGVCADIQIGENDMADVAKNNTGLVMKDKDTDHQFYIYTQNLPGLVNAHTRWIGSFDEKELNIWNESLESSITGGVAGDRESGIDTGVAFSWQDVLVRPGETKTLTFILNVE